MTCSATKPVIGIIMGSESDMPVMDACMKQLDEFGVPYEVKIASAHRKPAEVHEYPCTRYRGSHEDERSRRLGLVALYGADAKRCACRVRGHQRREECGYFGCSDDGYGL